MPILRSSLPFCAALTYRKCGRSARPLLPLCGGRGCSSIAASGADLCQRAARALYSMERFHRQSNSAEERRRVEYQAWRALQGLPDEAVNTEGASASDIAEILGSWCYFSRFWGRGMQGPEENEAIAAAVVEDVVVPSVERSAPPRPPTADYAPPPRHNPLDEVLEF